MKVPRPTGGSRQSTGVGKIFVKYDNADSARTALQALAGRKFADRTVVTTYFAEVSCFSPFLFLQRILCYEKRTSELLMGDVGTLGEF